jgi:hypothetical protein
MARGFSRCAWDDTTMPYRSLRISAIVDACFRLIVDGESVWPWLRWASAQELV